jgi:hypothetical protein
MQSESHTSGQPSAGLSAAPLFHAAWLFAVGIAVTHWVWLRPGLVLAAMAPVTVLCGLAVLRAQRIAWLPLATLWCLLGAWCALMEPQPAPAPALASLSDGLLRSMEGTVVDSGAVKWAVISCGLRNRDGHPRSEILDELQSAQVRTYRTDTGGASCFMLDGKIAVPDPTCGWR